MRAAPVPVKALDDAKSRLLGVLDEEPRRALVLAMLADVLAALRGVAALDLLAVVTPDSDVAEAARAQGAEVLLRRVPGLNPSLDAAAAELAARGVGELLVVLGDVAGARAEDLERLFRELAQLGGSGVVLARSQDGGTAALLRAPPAAIPHRFGPRSARAHADAAAAAGVPCRVVTLDSLGIDLDRPADLETLLAGSHPARHTRALLEHLGVSPAGARAAGEEQP